MAKKRVRIRRKPQRMCISCRRTDSKRELVRIVRRPDGEIAIDARGKMPGRGAYLCATRTCWFRALEQRRLGPALRTTLTDEQYAQLEAFASQLPDAEGDDEATNSSETEESMPTSMHGSSGELNS